MIMQQKRQRTRNGETEDSSFKIGNTLFRDMSTEEMLKARDETREMYLKFKELLEHADIETRKFIEPIAHNFYSLALAFDVFFDKESTSEQLTEAHEKMKRLSAKHWNNVLKLQREIEEEYNVLN
jgi:hypothetical protein